MPVQKQERSEVYLGAVSYFLLKHSAKVEGSAVMINFDMMGNLNRGGGYFFEVAMLRENLLLLYHLDY
jgi:hypothetical protein